MGLIKLKIKSYTDAGFNDRSPKEFDVPINPDEIVQNLKVKYNNRQAQGTQGNNPRYEKTEAEKMTLNFVLDTTGIIEVPESNAGMTVPEQIEKLRDVVYKLEGETHEPKYLKIIWGQMLGEDKAFECRMASMRVTYTLFSPEALPLRAKVQLEIIEFTSPPKRVRQEKKESPDLTHLREVKDGDTLPLKTYEMYKDTSYFLEVAKVNGITNFRNIPTGKKLFFPPIKEQ